MLRTFSRRFLPNPFDWLLKRTARKGGKKILLCWNRGLGDIPLGLYATVERIRTFIPDAEITFLTRENLREGFSLLEGIHILTAPDWKRGEKITIDNDFKKQFDLVIENPSPTDWVYWQLGKVTPKLKWNPVHDALHQKFNLQGTFVGVQVAAETNHGPWRNWPLARWQELFDQLEKRGIQVLLFGYGNEPKFTQKNIVDLRGKTTLLELLSIIKNRCFALVLPDSGIASTTYYIDASFPLRLITLWADPTQGILKQRVASPNPQLIHSPLIGENRDLSNVTAEKVLNELFAKRPLLKCNKASEVPVKPVANVGAILLAAGQGTRLQFEGPKGLFSVAGKTLFQWHCENCPPHTPLAIMTSPLNHEETVNYFEKNRFFGLEVFFFQQEMLPFLDEEKKPMELKGPNGNGSLFRSFVQAGLGDQFAKKGIDFVTVTYVDNPLAKLLDPALISYAREEKADATLQCVERRQNESMGVLVEGKGIEVVEYTELDPSIHYPYAYSGQIAFALPFFCKMAEVELPLHWVRKKVQNQWVWKGEKFIFDSLPYASRVRALSYSREACYGPLKTLEDLEAVQKKLRERL